MQVKYRTAVIIIIFVCIISLNTSPYPSAHFIPWYVSLTKKCKNVINNWLYKKQYELDWVQLTVLCGSKLPGMVPWYTIINTTVNLFTFVIVDDNN